MCGILAVFEAPEEQNDKIKEAAKFLKRRGPDKSNLVISGNNNIIKDINNNMNLINLYNYYSNPKNEYFNLLRNFAEHLIDNDIIFEDENNIDIKICKKFTKEYSYSNEKELKFIYEYLIPEFIKNSFDTILYECDIIYLNKIGRAHV